MLYAVFSGQPMTFVGPTGLTLAFISTLYRFTKANSLPFLEIYSWTGRVCNMILECIYVIPSISFIMNYSKIPFLSIVNNNIFFLHYSKKITLFILFFHRNLDIVIFSFIVMFQFIKFT